jgi:hypothetical protein
MSAGRLPSSRSKARRKAVKNSPGCHRFMGIALSGGKSDKTCIAVIEYFPEHKKVFLARLFEKIKTEAEISADLKIIEHIEEYKGQIETVAFDVPLTLPTCLTCKLKCPGFEVCQVPQIEWMRDQYKEILKQKKPKKIFTPYTQRCSEVYLSHCLEENFEIHHALGANLAPLTARALFLQKRISAPVIEVSPKVSIWRLGMQAKVGKSHLKFHRHSVSGDESRRVILQSVADDKNIFIYHQDFKIMIENSHAFEAFICAYTAFLKFKKLTESRPKSFPAREAWIEIPKR